MRSHVHLVRWGCRISLLACLVSWAGAVWAQAWVPPPGQGSIGFGYQYTLVSNHLFSVDAGEGTGNAADLGQIVGNTGELSLDYGLLPRLAVSASGAYVSTRYDGTFPEGPTDDGQFHSSFQDLSLAVRYMFRWKQLAITPLAGATIPMTDYPAFGHSATGSGIRSYPLGIALGAPVGFWGFLQAGYTRTIVEDAHGHDLDRDNYRVEGGYFVGPAVALRAFFNYAEAVDGVNWDQIATEEEWHAHDVARKELVRRAGGSLSYRLGDRIGAFLEYEGTLSGANTHSSRATTFGMSWSFTGPSLFRR